MFFKNKQGQQARCEADRKNNDWWIYRYIYRYYTRVKRYPLVVSSSKGFRIKLGTLVLFEAYTGAGTGLKNTTTTTTHRKGHPQLREIFNISLNFSCSTVVSYLVWTELVLFRRANTIWAVYILCGGQSETETGHNIRGRIQYG